MSTAKGIGPEAAAYAAALRAAVHGFTGRGGTQKEIAHSVHVSPAALSRYLSGERIAPLSFLAALDSFLTDRGRPLEAGVRARLDELCGLAQEASGSPAVQLAHLKDELARVRKEKHAGKAELAALKKHADELAAALRQALDEAHSSEQERLALRERVTGQGKNLEHAQTYTRQLQAELTALQEQVVLIQREVKVLRRQNKHLIEGSTTRGTDSGEDMAVSGASTQATGTQQATSKPPGHTTRGGRKGKAGRHKTRPQASGAGTPGGKDQKMPLFFLSWTGDEDPKTFSESKLVVGGWLSALLGSAFLLYAISNPEEGSPVVLYAVGGVFMAFGIALADDLLPQNNVRRAVQARVLCVDRTGLGTSDSSGRQHIPWDAIKKVSVHRTKTIHERAPLALHVQLRSGATIEAERIYRPAGWPLAHDPPEACKRPVRTWADEWVPVCVLGPLTGPDKTSLQNTLTHYLKEPLEGIW
ncbi:helix-turn-helix domain-containing protein [Streptomyces sp. NPDC102402]|uniref:helix-turn-helix domain-containing protein n=1 Tax=Streptomyces sp. NPDC102402 TaxID=3366169 RepID=UPI00380274D6